VSDASVRARSTIDLTTEEATGPPLASWTDGATKQAILEFVDRSVAEVAIEDRVAVFDNDGTLWCERPMPIQADFIVRRMTQMARNDPGLAERQPWKAAVTQDNAWFARVLDEHYAGNDADVGILLSGVLAAFDGTSVESFEAAADAFLRDVHHPTLARPYRTCAFTPMVELLAFLRRQGFANYIASGGGRDFMRPISEEIYGVSRDRVIGSTSALEYRGDPHGGTIVHKAEADYIDDGPAKPVRIWSRVGRRPILAAGNANGDIPMLEFAQHADRPSLRLLIAHDDAAREFDYTRGAERALDRARAEGWTVVSLKRDWQTVFEPTPRTS
jgi:phosphoglycolate phosphatase-like HAD superfamily hydrolase